MKTIHLFALGLICMAILTSCKKDEDETPVIPNEEELITTLIYTLTPVGGGTPVVYSFRDIDGEGGNPPVVIEGILAANTDYTGVISLLNESSDPVDDITVEVQEEGVDHQLFYQTEAALNMNVTYTDVDANGKPIGVATLISAGTTSSGNLTITLRHEPDKNASGVSSGDITNAGGETDIEVSFIVEIE